MNEDYLWNKKGEDKEIAELENSLKQFRSTNTTPPELPQKAFVFDKDTLTQTKTKFPFKFALATFACLAIVAFGTFQLLNFDDQELAKNTSRLGENKQFTEKLTIAPTKIIKNETKAEKPVQPIIEKAKFVPKQKRRTVKVKKTIRPKIKTDQMIAKKTEPKPIIDEPKVKKIKVTKEEKEAYDKLMEALAITGSQMRIVQEKINGVDETKPPKKDGR